MEKAWKVIAAFIGVFIAGTVFGYVFTIADRLASHSPSQHPLVQLPPAHRPSVSVAGPHLPNNGGPAPTAGISVQLMRQFTKSLNLTPKQRGEVQPVLERAAQDFQRLRIEEVRRRKEHTEDVARVNNRMYVDVSKLLTLEQREQMSVMRQKSEDRLQAQRVKQAEDATGSAKRTEPRVEQP